MRYKLKTVFQCILLFFGSWMSVFGRIMPSHQLQIDIKSVCLQGPSIWVTLHSPTQMKCVIEYRDLDGTENNNTEPFIATEKNVTLSSLKNDTNYIVSAFCSGGNSVPKVVKTGVCMSKPDSSLDQKTLPDADEPDVTYKEKALFSSSAIDIVLGLMFGVAAIVTLVMTAYYMYRKYQRRRRLQQFLSTPHTDPFETLQSYMEEES